MKVQCPGCKRIQHETTKQFKPGVLVNGSFVKLTEKYAKRGWNCFDEGGAAIATTGPAMMLCPSCGMSLAPKGRLIITTGPKKALSQAEKNQIAINTFSDEEENLLECKICGKICKSLLGLNSHMRKHSRC